MNEPSKRKNNSKNCETVRDTESVNNRIKIREQTNRKRERINVPNERKNNANEKVRYIENKKEGKIKNKTRKKERKSKPNERKNNENENGQESEREG